MEGAPAVTGSGGRPYADSSMARRLHHSRAMRFAPLSLVAVLLWSSACVVDPSQEADGAGVDAALKTVVARTAAEIGALSYDAEARSALCYAVLGEGWLRDTTVSPDSFLQSCAYVVVNVDRAVIAPQFVDAATGLPRVEGYETHLDAGGVGFDVVLTRTRIESGREVWIGKVAPPGYPSAQIEEARTLLQAVVGVTLLPLGYTLVNEAASTVVTRDVEADLARRAEQSGMGEARVATVLAVVHEGARVGTLVAVLERNATGSRRGVLLYYDPAGHFLADAPWDSGNNLPGAPTSW